MLSMDILLESMDTVQDFHGDSSLEFPWSLEYIDGFQPIPVFSQGIPWKNLGNPGIVFYVHGNSTARRDRLHVN
jgi:hypothetical protein